MKLDVIEKVVRPIAVTTLVVTLSIIMILAPIYVSFIAAYAFEPHVGLPIGFLIMVGGYLLVFLLFFFFRKQWVGRPLVRFLISLLTEK